MLVDSWYDSYLGVIVLVRVIHGQLKKNQKIVCLHLRDSSYRGPNNYTDFIKEKLKKIINSDLLIKYLPALILLI